MFITISLSRETRVLITVLLLSHLSLIFPRIHTPVSYHLTSLLLSSQCDNLTSAIKCRSNMLGYLSLSWNKLLYLDPGARHWRIRVLPLIGHLEDDTFRWNPRWAPHLDPSCLDWAWRCWKHEYVFDCLYFYAYPSLLASAASSRFIWILYSDYMPERCVFQWDVQLIYFLVAPEEIKDELKKASSHDEHDGPSFQTLPPSSSPPIHSSIPTPPLPRCL